jgi:hypothetical protein
MPGTALASTALAGQPPGARLVPVAGPGDGASGSLLPWTLLTLPAA